MYLSSSKLNYDGYGKRQFSQIWRCTLIGKEPDLKSGDGLKATAGSSPAISSIHQNLKNKNYKYNIRKSIKNA